jgi:hypothetical protein
MGAQSARAQWEESQQSAHELEVQLYSMEVSSVDWYEPESKKLLILEIWLSGLTHLINWLIPIKKLLLTWRSDISCRQYLRGRLRRQWLLDGLRSWLQQMREKTQLGTLRIF